MTLKGRFTEGQYIQLESKLPLVYALLYFLREKTNNKTPRGGECSEQAQLLTREKE